MISYLFYTTLTRYYMKLQLFVLCLFGMSSYFVSSQIITSDGGTINVNTGGVLHLNGGMLLSNSSVLTNNGNISVTKNSTLVESGNFILNSNTTVSGSGVYNIEKIGLMTQHLMQTIVK